MSEEPTTLATRPALSMATRGRGLAPTSYAEMFALAKCICSTALVPPQYRNKPEDTLVAIQMGAEVGLSPMQAIQNIAVINGRPTMYGDACIALAMQSGLVEDFEETFEGAGDELTAVCRIKRKGIRHQYVGRFSMRDAKKAGLANKQGPWQQYTNRMLMMRARGFVLRDGFADVLKGLIAREEAMDYPAPTGPSPFDEAPPIDSPPGATAEQNLLQQIEDAPDDPKDLFAEPPPESEPSAGDDDLPRLRTKVGDMYRELWKTYPGGADSALTSAGIASSRGIAQTREPDKLYKALANLQDAKEHRDGGQQ